MRMEGVVIWDCDERTGMGHIVVFGHGGNNYQFFKFTKNDWVSALGKQGDAVSFSAIENSAKEIRLLKS